MKEKEIILKMISDGKISAEEGAELLEEIEKSRKNYGSSQEKQNNLSFTENLTSAIEKFPNKFLESFLRKEL